MSEEELLEFKEQLRIDPDLLAELDIHRLTDEFSLPDEEDRFRKKLATAYDEFENKRIGLNSNNFTLRSTGFLIGAGSAMTAAVIIILLIIFKPFMLTQDEIFIKYYEPFTLDYSSRSVIDEEYNYPENAIQQYLDGNYKASLHEMTTYISKNKPNTVIANFYMGLAAMENAEYNLAIKSFQDVLREDFSFLHEHSQWYLSLTYLKLGKPDIAEENFVDLKLQRSIYSKKSKKILNKIH